MEYRGSPRLPDQVQTEASGQDHRSAHQESYRLDENIGSESRSVEFKSGGGFIKYDFRKNVAKYVCGFVNSGENGTLKIGIKDSGTVKGYSANHRQEDQIRNEIDGAFTDIEPVILPTDYSVQFVPVLDSSGDQQIPDTWVIEIFVAGGNIGVRDRPYETKQGVFMRRDGGVQGPLSAQKIQEWTRRQYQAEIDKLKRNEVNRRKDIRIKQRDYGNMERQLVLKEEKLAQRERELTNMKQDHSQKTDKLETQIKQLQSENTVLKTSNEVIQTSNEVIQKDIGEIKTMLSTQSHKQSKVCTIL